MRPSGLLRLAFMDAAEARTRPVGSDLYAPARKPDRWSAIGDLASMMRTL